MAINLQKGQTISLEKQSSHLDEITVGLGLEIKKKGFVAGLAGGNAEHDLDAIAFVLNAEGKVSRLGEKLVDGDVVFFNNLRHPGGEIYHSGDNRTGGSGATDDEQIVVRLKTVPGRCNHILFEVRGNRGQGSRGAESSPAAAARDPGRHLSFTVKPSSNLLS